MRVLLLGADTPLGAAIVQRQGTRGRHDIVPISRSACRWKSERQAKKSVARAKSDIVVDVRIEAAGDSGSQIQPQDVQRCHWVAKACQRTGTGYFFISSSRVFSGQKDRPYVEADYPDNEETVGQLLTEAEQIVARGCQRSLVLRLGPIFSDGGTNLISQILGPLQKGGSLILDNHLRGCPVAAADGARVVLAILDQVGTGVEAWGTYHYGSSDTATYYEFAEALLAAASQFSEFSSSAVQLESESSDLAPLDRTLDCARIRNTFAIRQVPWRSAIGDLVKRYYENSTGTVNAKGH